MGKRKNGEQCWAMPTHHESRSDNYRVDENILLWWDHQVGFPRTQATTVLLTWMNTTDNPHSHQTTDTIPSQNGSPVSSFFFFFNKFSDKRIDFIFFCFLKIFIYFWLLILYWSIADEQYCDSFRWTAKGLSHTHTCIHSPPNSPPTQAATEHWAELSVPYSRSLLVIHFKYSRVPPSFFNICIEKVDSNFSLPIFPLTSPLIYIKYKSLLL